MKQYNNNNQKENKVSAVNSYPKVKKKIRKEKLLTQHREEEGEKVEGTLN